MCKEKFEEPFKEFIFSRVDSNWSNFEEADKEYKDFMAQFQVELFKIKTVVLNENLEFFEKCLDEIKSKITCLESIIADSFYLKGLKEGMIFINVLKTNATGIKPKEAIQEQFKEYVEHFIGLRVEEISYEAINESELHKDLNKKIIELQKQILEKLPKDSQVLLYEYEEANNHKDSLIRDALYKNGFEDGKNIIDLFLENNFAQI